MKRIGWLRTLVSASAFAVMPVVAHAHHTKIDSEGIQLVPGPDLAGMIETAGGAGAILVFVGLFMLEIVRRRRQTACNPR